VKAGRFRFHALPFTLESDACEPEEMARGFVFSSELCRKYGMPLPRSGKKTDVPSHGGALATVLAHGGVKFMHIGCNWPSGCVETPGLFWWEGPDGSRVLTFYSNTYGTCVPPWMPRWYGEGDPFISTSLAPTPDWPYPVWPAILVTPDNSGPPKAEQVKALFEDAAKNLPGVNVRMGTMDDFVNAMLATDAEIPVVRGEMPDTWIHGVMSDPGGIRLSREVHPQIAAAEALHTNLNLWGVARPPVAKEVALAYEKMLLYGEHTWGRAPSVSQYGDAFKTVDPKLVAELEGSWEDKTDYIREASRISRGLMAANLQALANAVQRDAPCLVVYNPLPWMRSGTVDRRRNRVRQGCAAVWLLHASTASRRHEGGSARNVGAGYLGERVL
jgi:alpha-mannosidase